MYFCLINFAPYTINKMASSILSGTPAQLAVVASALKSAVVQPNGTTSIIDFRTDIDASGGVHAAHFMTGSVGGGGLAPLHYQCFLYDPVTNDASGAAPFDELWDGYSIGNNVGIMRINRGLIAPTRVGTVTGNGATPVDVSCPSIGAGSQVAFGLLAASALPAAAPTVSDIEPNLGFSVVAAAGAIYQYEVIG